MKFIGDDIGGLVLEELSNAVEARLAVAFFNPDDQTLAALARLPKLTLIVSEEFTINNPYKLEKLGSAILRSVRPDADEGKLHAKVLIITRPNGSYWTLLGSANVTHQGMFVNQEACVAMQSSDPTDEESVRKIVGWFASLLKTARYPDLAQAKLIFDSRSRYILQPRPTRNATRDAGYWALKPPRVGRSSTGTYSRRRA
jgi:phosphatidylserine/phosphatidylglycerophosphate/cardiolipin synthase-like enzyme